MQQLLTNTNAQSRAPSERPTRFWKPSRPCCASRKSSRERGARVSRCRSQRARASDRPDLCSGRRGCRQAVESRDRSGVTVDGDRELLAQLLVNLIENALRHTQDAAGILVELAADAARLCWPFRTTGRDSRRRAAIASSEGSIARTEQGDRRKWTWLSLGRRGGRSPSRGTRFGRPGARPRSEHRLFGTGGNRAALDGNAGRCIASRPHACKPCVVARIRPSAATAGEKPGV